MEIIETIIVGGGQAGLSASYYLKQLGREHIVFEQAEKAGNAWRNDRWDSFTFVTPNWMIKIPGAHYEGKDPDGFLLRHEIVAYFERYVEKFNLPVQFKTSVLEVTRLEENKGYQVKTPEKNFKARNVVIATGSFQKPKIPSFSVNIPANVIQLHSGKYRNPEHYRMARCWWLARRNRAPRSQRSSIRVAAQSIYVWGLPRACRVVIAAGMCSDGWWIRVSWIVPWTNFHLPKPGSLATRILAVKTAVIR